MKKTHRRGLSLLLTALLCLSLLPACGSQTAELEDEAPILAGLPAEAVAETKAVDSSGIAEEAAALASAPAPGATPSTSAPGTRTQKNSKAVIDYSNSADGYVMVKYTLETDKRIKAQVKGPGGSTYTYNLTPTHWAAFPLSDGNGSYQISVFENVSGSKYAAVISLQTSVKLADDFAPFLHSNQYVDYDAAPRSVAKAAELTAKSKSELDKVAAVYDYVVNSLTYDKALAKSVKSGYLPELDEVLAKRSGICFDYAALMTGMLRSQGVPCKLVVGYAGSAYHAWISVWTESQGWIDGVIFFNGSEWQRMDPTFASSGKQSDWIMDYIGDGKNYSAKYFY